MNELCEVLRPIIATIFGKDTISDWEIFPSGSYSCIVRTPQVLITFNEDQRDHLISSKIRFSGVSETHSDDLYSHIIYKIFPNIGWNSGIGVISLKERAFLEVKNVNNILKSAKKNDISAKELFYFQCGYDCGYTENFIARE